MGEANNTTVAADGSPATLLVDSFNVQAGWRYLHGDTKALALSASQNAPNRAYARCCGTPALPRARRCSENSRCFIVASWGAEVERFRLLRAPYLIY